MPLVIKLLGLVDCVISDPVPLPASMAAVFFINWQTGVLKYYWVNLQWVKSHRSQQNRHSDSERTFQSRITGCSGVFQGEKKYVKYGKIQTELVLDDFYASINNIIT